MIADKPWEEDIVRGSVTDANGVLTKTPLPMTEAKSLAEMVGDFVFFTPAILYRFAEFTDAVLIDFVTKFGRCDFYWVKLDFNIFQGLELGYDEDWNRALWAIPLEKWNQFVDFMCSAWFVDSWKEKIEAIALQRFVIVDPVALSKAYAVQRLSIFAFGIRGSLNNIYFAFPSGKLPQVTFGAPDKESLRLKKILLQENANPLVK